MFIRENKNRSGSVSVQVIIKINGRNKILKTVGCGTQRHEIDRLRELARQEIDRLQSQPRLFNSGDDELIESTVSYLSNSPLVLS